MSITFEESPQTPPNALRWAGYILGFSIGGFFDGILLHQILQWHHLLSGLQSRSADLRFQILADGIFHALMYLLALIGLWLLWRARGAFAGSSSGRLLLADALIGFGVWHVVDTFASHWLLGIHRIRMDSDMPLFWDLLWLVLFGVVFIAAGWWLRRGGGRMDPGAIPGALVLCTVLLGAGAALPAGAGSTAIIVFRQDITPAQAFAALAEVDGRLVWSDSTDKIWAVDLPREASTLHLYRSGALLVSGSLLPAGCSNWFRL